MVMRLPPPGTCSINLIESVVEERQGGINAEFFTRIKYEWTARVREYIFREGSPCHIPLWLDIEDKKKSFINLYSSPKEGSSQGEMLKNLREHGLNLCPACGEAGSPNTLDHYLPKRKFPHFSVTPLNLFPMCDACQVAKDEKTGDTGGRFFIHPYFDTFSVPQIVFLILETPFLTPTFSIEPHAALQPSEYTLVSAHLRELNVHARYARFFKTEFRRLLRLVDEMRRTGQDVIPTLKTFRHHASTPTQNSWEHIFYDGVLKNEEFLEFLEAGTFPDYL
jgi:hypothetical protein